MTTLAAGYFYLIILAFFGILFILYFRLRNISGGDSVASSIDSLEIIEIQISKNELSPKEVQLPAMAAENMFAAIHGLLREDPMIQEHLSFELVSSGSSGIRFYVAVPTNLLKFVESQIYAHYPSVQLRVVQDYATKFEPQQNQYEVATVTFTRPSYFPIKSYRDIETDTMSSFTSAMSSVAKDEEVWFQMLVKPLADVWQKEGQDYVAGVRAGTAKIQKSSPLGDITKTFTKEIGFIARDIVVGAFTYKPREVEDPRFAPKTPELRLTATQELELRAIEDKLSRMGFEVQIRVFASSSSKDTVESHLRSVLASLKQLSTSTQNSFISHVEASRESSLNAYRRRSMDPEKAIIMNTQELATMYHLPSSNIETPNISWVFSRKSEPPANLPTQDCTYIGRTTFRSKQVKFGIANVDDRLRHMYLIGKSGTGKSTLLESMITQDIQNGAGLGVLDPHGETIDRVLERIPDHRLDDVIYFDPSDVEHPIGLNLLEMDDPSQKNLMASGLISAIRQHFDYSWGPRLEYLLNYAILTLLEVPGTTMMGITRLMEDQNYQKYILHQVKDQGVIKFWEKEFKEMKGNQKLVTEAIAPIQNKVNRFLASTTIRNILGQKKSTLNLWDAMNNGKILLMNLSKGKIGSDNANLLGALLVSRIQFYALQRAKIPYDQRRPFYLYVDEFQNFATGSFEEILSESRKYKLGLYLTHQFTGQLPEELQEAVFGNVGTIATFSLGAQDAKELAREFAPYFTEEDIISLERFYIYIKLMVDGMTSHPFSARIMVPWEEENFMVPKTPNRDKVIELSRQKYGVDKQYIEDKINKWFNTPFDKGMAIAQEKRADPNYVPAQPTDVTTPAQPEQSTESLS